MVLLIAGCVAILTQRFALPYMAGLTLTGLVFGLSGIAPPMTLSKTFLYEILLPPLIFEAALYLPWSSLKRDIGLVLVLASLGVILSAMFIAAGMMGVLGWGLYPALFFGVIISATDPVSVIALFRAHRVESRFRTLLEGEALFNDAIVAVLVSVMLALLAPANGGSWAQMGLGGLKTLGISVFGGLGIGLGIGAVALFLAGKSHDPLVEMIFSLVGAYGAFWLAEYFGASGILASLAAGMLIASQDRQSGQGRFTDKGYEMALNFWEFLAFAANAVIFILIGWQLSQQGLWSLGLTVVVGIGLSLVGRAFGILPFGLVLKAGPWALNPAEQSSLIWGGLRGALAIALSSALPSDLSHRQDIVSLCYAAAAFSALVQGPLAMRHIRRKIIAA